MLIILRANAHKAGDILESLSQVSGILVTRKKLSDVTIYSGPRQRQASFGSHGVNYQIKARISR